MAENSKAWKYWAVFFGSTLFLLFLGWKGLLELQFRGWEGLLRGPYAGADLDNGSFTNASSTLNLPKGYRLSVFPDMVRTNEDSWPAVVLYSPEGRQTWARLLQPEVTLTDGSKFYPFVRDLQLERVREGQVSKVIISCVWGHGGSEGGIIYLEPDYSFRGFSISW